jgi:N-glycosylase/DNA lyase
MSIPNGFSFVHAVKGHGWYDLAPFEFDEANAALTYVTRDRRTGAVSEVTVRPANAELIIDVDGNCDTRTIKRDVQHILRLDEELQDFYALASANNGIAWAAEAGAGRLLRSATVFEDVVKTICTTNCSWSLTRKMTTNLVALLGDAAPGGRKAFPTPASMAAVGAEFYRDEIRAGYRSAYLAEFAERVSAGDCDPEGWLDSELPTPELRKEMLKVKGIGGYAADHMLKLLGRYDRLALDSWLRSRFYEKHNRARACPDKKIERHYKKFGKWKGLALWCDMTEDWFEQAP